MKADYDAKQYYYMYINSINKSIKDTKENIDKLKKDIIVVHDYLISNSVLLIFNNNNFKIGDYFKLIGENKFYNEYIDYLNKEIKTTSNIKYRQYLIQMLKYYSINNKIKDNKELLIIIKDRSKIKFRQFESYLRKYYYCVHNNLIYGYQYKFSNRFGYLGFNRWKFENTNNLKKTIIDFKATNMAKQELIKKGKKPYDKKEAEYYKLKGWKYDGIQYTVFKNDDYFVDLELVDGTLPLKSTIVFDKLFYVGRTLKTISFDEIAKKYKTLEEINELPLAVTHKMTIYNKINKGNDLNYIRHGSENKYLYRKYYSKNRQRFQP